MAFFRNIDTALVNVYWVSCSLLLELHPVQPHCNLRQLIISLPKVSKQTEDDQKSWRYQATTNSQELNHIQSNRQMQIMK